MAAATLADRYPFLPEAQVQRRYTSKQMVEVFIRDGFIDRYTGERLVFPGTLRLISAMLPSDFPFQKNWKVSETHPAYWHLCPTIDHVVPIVRGGNNDVGNLVTTTQLKNSTKANWTLDELGWELHPPGDMAVWDGLTGAFMRLVEVQPSLLNDNYVRAWHRALKAVVDRRGSGRK